MRKKTVRCEYFLLLLYPAAFLFLASHPVALYVGNFYLSPYMAALTLFGAATFWLSSPLSRFVRGHLPTTFLFYLLPLLSFLFMVFSQYHPLISVLLLCLIPALVCAALIPLCRSVPMGRKQLKTALVRLSCGAAALVLLLPAILACTVYQLDQPRQMARGEVWKEILTVKPADTDLAALENELSSQLTLLNQEQWKEMGSVDKIEALQAVAALSCARMGIPAADVQVVGLPFNTLGQFSSEKNLIQISPEVLDRESTEAVAVVLHECRHKLQKLVSEAVDWTAPASAAPYFDEARNWHNNLMDYQSSGEAYVTQPVEVDANAYSAEEISYYTGYLTPQHQN